MANKEHIFLQLKEFKENISNKWKELSLDKDFCDMTLACNENQIRVHRVVMSSSSSVIRDVLKHNIGQDPFIHLGDVKYVDLLDIIEFIYKGEVKIKKGSLSKFLTLAQDMKIKGLYQNQKENHNGNEEMEDIKNLTGETTLIEKNLVGNNLAKTEFDNSEINDKNSEYFTNKSVMFDKMIMTEYDKQNLSSVSNDEGILFPCKGCNNLFSDKMQLNMHNGCPLILKKEDNILFSCDQCEYKTPNKYNLKEHTKTVHEGHHYSCDKCSFKTRHKLSIKRHADSIHNGIQWPCNKCVFKAKDRSHLIKHTSAIHEGICYPCELCNFKANYKSVLLQHVQSKHENIWYTCDQCEYKTTFKGSVRRHKDSVHGEIYFPCTECSFVTKDKGNVRKHVIRKHKSKE